MKRLTRFFTLSTIEKIGRMAKINAQGCQDYDQAYQSYIDGFYDAADIYNAALLENNKRSLKDLEREGLLNYADSN